jgi:eukaryotic-like serine/threonine-protein kinase
MLPEQSERVAELVDAALQREPAERPAFLDEACRETPDLRAEVDSLLAFQIQARDFIETPAYEWAGEDVLDQIGEFRIGQTFGDYKIVALLAEGGMGEVYLAQDTALDRKVAIKLIKTGLGTASFVRHFRNEQRILAGLNHPNIARLYDAAITSDGLPYFVMEYVEGTRIDDFCRDNELSLRDRLELFLKACAAVGFAHRHLIIHRDLKPANIRVTPEGEPKLLDFGIAKLLDPETAGMVEQTMTLQALMTPDYASPEQVRGETMTTASDVYSLGVVLYELLTGQRPHRLTSRRPDEIARAIQEEEATKPSTAVAKCDGKSEIENRRSKLLKGDLDNIVLKAIRKEPDRRYQSVRQFSDDIRRHLEGLPVTARKDTLRYRASKFVARNRLAVAAAAAVMFAILGGLFVSLYQTKKAREQRDLAQQQKIRAERINQFLHRTLSFSNQSLTSVSPVAQRKDVTVNEMLDQIAPQIGTELADQPEVRAQVLHTIGAAYASQGRYDAAEKNLGEVLKLYNQLGQLENAEAAATQVELGLVYYREQKFQEAIPLLENAVAFYRRQRAQNSSEYNPARFAFALDSLADATGNYGKLPEAISLMREAYQIASQANLSADDRYIRIYAKGDLGAGLIMQGKLEEGQWLMREAVAEYRQAFDKPRWELGGFLMVLGTAELARNHLDRAQQYLVEGEQILKSTLGDNIYLASDLMQQATVALQKKDFVRAEQKAREAVAISQRVPGVNKLAVVSAMSVLADILTKAGHFSDAEKQYRDSLTLCESQAVRNHSLSVSLKVRLSQTLLAQNRFSEAEQTALGAQEEAQKSLAKNDPLLEAISTNLTQIRTKTGKTEPASFPKSESPH